MEKTNMSKNLTNGSLITDEKEKKNKKIVKRDPENDEDVVFDDKTSSEGGKRDKDKI
jgi:hypothetical protein